MSADNHITIEGRLTKDAVAGNGRGPGRFRVATYCSGTKANDNIATAFVNVKQFDMDVDSLTTGTKVRIEGRFAPWTDKDGNQVLDVMADTIELIDDDRAPRQAPKVRQVEEEEEL